MAHRRMFVFALLALTGARVAAAAPSAPQPATPPQDAEDAQYYYPERRRRRRRRRVCWTERRRVFVGYDRWGRALWRSVPRRVCRWRYY